MPEGALLELAPRTQLPDEAVWAREESPVQIHLESLTYACE